MPHDLIRCPAELALKRFVQLEAIIGVTSMARATRDLVSAWREEEGGRQRAEELRAALVAAVNEAQLITTATTLQVAVNVVTNMLEAW